MNCNIEELCTLKRLKYRRQNTKHLEDKRADHKNVMMVRIIYIKSCAKHRNIAHKLKKKELGILINHVPPHTSAHWDCFLSLRLK